MITEMDCSAAAEASWSYRGPMPNDIPVISGYDEARAALADPGLVVPPVLSESAPGGIRWLRASVARFSSGEPHLRRRSLAQSLLSTLDTAELRDSAFDRTSAVLRFAAGGQVDLMNAVARAVPVGVLARALGIDSDVTADVAVVSRAYHPHVEPEPAADEAVTRLVDACGGMTDEATAARIGLLVQACDATAALVGNAVLSRAGSDRAPEESVVSSLREDPPVRRTRRLVVATGSVVAVDLSDHPFGAGPHSCPGHEQAIAIAAGILDAVRGYRPVSEDVDYEPSPNLRMPARLEMIAR